MSGLNKKEILRLFELLNDELSLNHEKGELVLVGGAVMCLVYETREATQDIDAFFKPSSSIRKAAQKISAKEKIPENWLNDGVKGFLSEFGDHDLYLDLSHLKIWTASSEYMLAMKCLSMRIGAEFHDEDDIRYLLRNLDITSYQEACDIISQYYPLKRFPQKTLYALEEIIEG